MTFRLLTLNIQNGQPWDEKNPDAAGVDIDGVADFLLSRDADVLCLQEVEQGHDGGMQVEPPPNHTRLREILRGYDSVFGYPKRNETEIPFGLGLAIFSRTPLRDFQRIDLPAAPLEFEFAGKVRRASERLLIEAATTWHGREVRVLNAHLQAFFMIGASSDDHPEQRDILEKRLRDQSGAAVLAGDMNSAPGEGVVRQFGRAGFRTAQADGVTWRRRPYVVDHIFYNSPLRLAAWEVVPTAVSDHHAVVAEFEFAG